MAEITKERIYEILNAINGQLGEMDASLDEIRREASAVGPHLAGLRQDMSNIHGILARHDTRPDRIERRLDRVDAH